MAKTEKNENYTPERKTVENGEVPSKEIEKIETTDPLTVAEFVSQSLGPVKSLETISSESDGVPEADCDSVDIDLSVIEADMDLEELMKQKELLQAQLAAESGELHIPLPEETKSGKMSDEIILLDDSDDATPTVIERPKRKRSKSRERRIQLKSKEEAKRKRTDSRERSLRDSRDRDRDRYVRDVEKQRSKR